MHDTLVVSGRSVAGFNMNIGIVGLDSSHVISWLEAVASGALEQTTGPVRFVAAYPGPTTEMALSCGRVGAYTAEVRERWAVPIVDSIEAVLAVADNIMVCHVDARLRLEVLRVILPRARRVFVDKPLALDVATALEITRLAAQHGCALMSCSCLRSVGRACPEIMAQPAGAQWHVQGPMLVQPELRRYFWYAIHAVELLYAGLGAGAVEVTATGDDQDEDIRARWDGGSRVRWHLPTSHDTAFSVTCFPEKGPVQVFDVAAAYAEGHTLLVRDMVRFFATGETVVPMAETLEIIRFLEAAERSRAQGGRRQRIAPNSPENVETELT